MSNEVRPMEAFKYIRPAVDRPKTIVWLAKTDRLFATVQVITHGGETNLHAHSHLDGVWFVLRGRARFYSDLNTVAAELGEYEGILIPRGAKYWFESVGDEPLEILQVECSDIPLRTHEELMADRTDYTPPPRSGRTANVEAMRL
ncbi:MAG TPA: cupin domain-containing protein [Chloroflexota bacterium]|nr:cupin domain-containing protein [Chloroflexota bacterium]